MTARAEPNLSFEQLRLFQRGAQADGEIVGQVMAADPQDKGVLDTQQQGAEGISPHPGEDAGPFRRRPEDAGGAGEVFAGLRHRLQLAAGRGGG